MQLLIRSLAGVAMFLIALNGFASEPGDNQDMYIHVKNIQASKGSILIAIYDNEKDYMKVPAFTYTAPVNNRGEVQFQAQLPFGSYAITLFHDVNNNMELDTNFIGIPKEPYGFSNNSKALLPPKFQAALVEFNREGHEIEILLK